MSSSGEFKVDIKSTMAMFHEFQKKERKKVFRNAIQKSLSIVKKQVIKNLKSVINPDKINKKDEWGNSFRKGVKIKVYKGNKGGVIHILSNFKMKFFELGTAERYTTYKTRTPKVPLKKKRYTGRIKAYHYFTDAKKQTESQVFSEMEKRIAESIQKINDKYKNK